MLDLSLFRSAPFSGANIVVLLAYFGLFSIFFFTALYVQVVGNASAYQTALDFLPYGRRHHRRLHRHRPLGGSTRAEAPMTLGCLIAAGGILATDAVLAPTSGFTTLGWSLAAAGIGFGIALVPVTSAALSAVRPERSGMAASTTNTSRELGAVLGVAVLGALVNAKLTGQLAARLRAIGIPPQFQSLVLHAVANGGTASSGQASRAEHSKNAKIAEIATKVVHAAYSAFRSGCTWP